MDDQTGSAMQPSHSRSPPLIDRTPPPALTRASSRTLPAEAGRQCVWRLPHGIACQERRRDLRECQVRPGRESILPGHSNFDWKSPFLGGANFVLPGSLAFRPGTLICRPQSPHLYGMASRKNHMMPVYPQAYRMAGAFSYKPRHDETQMSGGRLQRGASPEGEPSMAGFIKPGQSLRELI
jgi:hypothetical protein